MRAVDVLVIGSVPNEESLFPGLEVLSVDSCPEFPTATLKHLGTDWPTVRQQLFGEPLIRPEIVFTERPSVIVDGVEVGSRALIVNSGSRAVFPDIPGFELLTSVDELPSLESVPESVVILGGGAQAAELIHLFERLGCEITVIHRSAVLLEREDSMLSKRYTDEIASKHDLRLRQQVVAVDRGHRNRILVESEDEYGVEYHCEGDLVVVATGRRPATKYPGFADSGIETDRGFIVVDDYGRTSVPGVYALGAVTRPWPSAEASLRDWECLAANVWACLDNPEISAAKLHPIPSRQFTPYVTGANPPIASVGLSDQVAGFFEAVTIEDEQVAVKLLGDPATGKLLGGHILGQSASALTQPLALALSLDLPVRQLAAAPWVRTPPTATLGRAVRDLAKLLG